MRYENFNQVKTLVEQIDKYKEKLDLLAREGLLIKINDYKGSPIYTIGVMSSSEHEYASVSRNYLQAITLDLEQRIASLKLDLQML